MSPDDEGEVVECPSCSAEYEKDSYCGECGYGQEVGELVEAEPEAAKQEPVYARAVDARPFPVHEAAWCPHCVAWLGTFPSKEEARAYEVSLANHPFEFCVRRKAKLNGSEEWRLRHEAAKFGSLALSPPTKPRVPAGEREEVSA
ncbi:MAG: hypothetical protein WDA16_07865 [Candidatus Thermoplasmatota archaeon]